MKRACLFIFMLMPAVAFGQAGSNQLGPLHLPFEFKIDVSGLFTYFSRAGSYVYNSSFGFDWVINSGDTNHHISGDSITYNTVTVQVLPNYEYPDSIFTSFMLIFDTNTKAISRLVFSNNNQGNRGFPNTSASEYYLSLTNLAYDSTSIYVADSKLATHLDSATWDTINYEQDWTEETYGENLDSVSSIDLAGNFRPTTLKNISGVAMPVTAPSGISVIVNNGIIQCELPPSNHPRTLELYTPLGMKAASIEIPAGQSEVSLPHLTSGLYFVRLEGNLVKIAVP